MKRWIYQWKNILNINKYRKFIDSSIYIFDKMLVPFIICSKCGNNNDKIFKEKQSIEILKILGSIDNRWFKVSSTCNKYGRRKDKSKIDETRNYFIEAIKQSDLMNRKHQNVCVTLNFIDH